MLGDCEHDRRFHLMGAINGCCACELELTKGQVEGATIRIHDLEVEVERLRTIVDQLPKTCDGQPLYVGMAVWTYGKFSTDEIQEHTVSSVTQEPIGDWWIEVQCDTGSEGGCEPDQLYSTREAAEAAKEERWRMT